MHARRGANAGQKDQITKLQCEYICRGGRVLQTSTIYFLSFGVFCSFCLVSFGSFFSSSSSLSSFFSDAEVILLLVSSFAESHEFVDLRLSRLDQLLHKSIPSDEVDNLCPLTLLCIPSTSLPTTTSVHQFPQCFNFLLQRGVQEKGRMKSSSNSRKKMNWVISRMAPPVLLLFYSVRPPGTSRQPIRSILLCNWIKYARLELHT